jgi:alanyl-tRNA synthetase
MSAIVPTAAQIRQTFLNFFKEKQHTIVASDSVGYTSRDGARIFTNAGMNQFVPIFLGERTADVDTWPGVLAKGLPTRAADTQKCIRAGGKHNDLEDVGLDTYHHTFFEMLGNWSFGDYFKAEAIGWSWELIVERFKFPPSRVFATIYQPNKDKGDPAERDEESWNLWAEKFRSVGLDPEIHIVNGNKKDNFWMMADTGPCGPCTEVHIDLTPGPVELDEERQRAGAKLVNGSDASCIEIWNNVFIQYNANPDGSFSPLPAKHVDTGMGFERLVSIIQGTKNFSDFETARISNYDTDVFGPIFDELSRLSGKRYQSTLPKPNAQGAVLPSTPQEEIDVAFRVIADHLRTLSFSIADGIQPGNSDRNYTLRRILRRAVKYGRALDFREPFFYKLVDVLAAHMGAVFPELEARREQIKQVLKLEEEAFRRTLDKGLALFDEAAAKGDISGELAFRLYDQEGFPIDLTELLARERGLKVDLEGFEKLMAEQRNRARAAMKKNVVSVSEISTKTPTDFVGYDSLQTEAKVLEVLSLKDKTAVVLDRSVCYAEMGGQVGDSAQLFVGSEGFAVENTIKVGQTWLHLLSGDEAPAVGETVSLQVDAARRHAIERHHTATHMLHWALHEVVSAEATQKGSNVSAGKLSFDFNSAALSPAQLRDIEMLVNERVLANEPVSWSEVPYAEAQQNKGIMQLFGEKYPERVRVVQIGGRPSALNGWSMELCGGTHTRYTGEIGLFRLLGESAVAAGVRRIEALAGVESYLHARQQAEGLRRLCSLVQAQSPADLEQKLEALLGQARDLERQLKAAQQREAAGRARDLITKAEGLVLLANLGEMAGDDASALAEALKAQFPGVAVLAAQDQGAVVLLASVGSAAQGKVAAGKIIQSIAPLVGGKGGGRPDFARGGGKDASRIDQALSEARSLIVTAGVA